MAGKKHLHAAAKSLNLISSIPFPCFFQDGAAAVECGACR
jgi:hypothetical protein